MCLLHLCESHHIQECLFVIFWADIEAHGGWRCCTVYFRLFK